MAVGQQLSGKGQGVELGSKYGKGGREKGVPAAVDNDRCILATVQGNGDCRRLCHEA